MKFIVEGTSTVKEPEISLSFSTDGADPDSVIIYGTLKGRKWPILQIGSNGIYRYFGAADNLNIPTDGIYSRVKDCSE